MNVFDLAAKISLDTKGYESALKQAGTDIGGLGTKIADTMKTAASKAVDALKTVAAAASDFALDSVKTGMDFDAAMSQVAATMGTTADQIGDLRDFAQEMGAATKFSATEAAEALNYMALAGYDAETSMGMLPNVLNLAAAGGMELAQASDMITDSLSAFGFDAKTEDGMKRANQMVDEMAKLSSMTNTNVEKLGNAFLTVGALASDLRGGFVTMSDGTKKATDGIQEMEIALGMMANAGIKGSEAGTHFRNILMKMTSGGEDIREWLGVDVFDQATGQMRSLKDIFSEMSVAFSKMTDNQKFDAMAALFNTRDTAAQEAILNAIGSDWDVIGEGILKSGGAAAAMAAEMQNNLAGDIDKLKSAFEGVKIALSDMVSPNLRSGVQRLTDLLSGLTTLFKGDRMAGLKSVGDAWDSIIGSIRTKVFDFVVYDLPELPQRIGAAFEKAKDFIMSEIGAWKPIGEQFLRTVISGMTELSTHADQIIPAITNLAANLTNPDNLAPIRGTASTIMENLINGLTSKESMDTFFDTEKGLPKVISNIVTNITNGAVSLLDLATTLIDKILTYMVDPANKKTIDDGVTDILVTLGDAFVRLVSTIHKNITVLMSDIMCSMVGEFDSDATALDMLNKLGQSLLKKLWDSTLPGRISNLWKGIKEMWNNQGYLDDDIADELGMTKAQWDDRDTNVDYQTAKKRKERYEALAKAADPGGNVEDFVFKYGTKGVPVFGNGGIVDKPTLALIGESGREAVVPLDRESEVGRQLGGMSVTFTGDIIVNGEKNVGREVVRQIDTALRQYQVQQLRGIGGTAWQT
jgi:TP901 family phage tail tape measure protein